jgi:hypothetical protein
MNVCVTTVAMVTCIWGFLASRNNIYKNVCYNGCHGNVHMGIFSITE